jgi:hypothetical protein
MNEYYNYSPIRSMKNHARHRHTTGGGRADQQHSDGINRRQVLRHTAAVGFGGLGIVGSLQESVTEPVGLLDACFVDQFMDPPPGYPTLDLTRENPKTAGNFPEGAEEFVIFIHGFIEKLADDGVRHGFTLEQALRQNGYKKPTVTAFWNSNVPVYQLAQRQAETARRRLASFLDGFLNERPDTTIRIVGHSLGSIVTLETLSEIVSDDVVESAALLGAAVDPADGSVRWRRPSTVPHNSDRVVRKVLPLTTDTGSSRCSVHQRSEVLSEAAVSALGGPRSAGA